MRLPAGGDQRLDAGLGAGIDIGRAEVAAIGQQRIGPSHFVGQGRDLVDHRRELLFVVGRLHHLGHNHQQAAFSDEGLRIVALLEPATGHRHDARILVGQVPFDERRFARNLMAANTDVIHAPPASPHSTPAD